MAPPRVPRFIPFTPNARGSNRPTLIRRSSAFERPQPHNRQEPRLISPTPYNKILNRHTRPGRSSAFKRPEYPIDTLQKADNGHVTAPGSNEADGIAVDRPETQESVAADLPEHADSDSATRPSTSSGASKSELSDEDGLSLDFEGRIRPLPWRQLHLADELLSLPSSVTQNPLHTEEYNQWRAFEERQSASDYFSEEESHSGNEEPSDSSSPAQILHHAAEENQFHALDYLSLRSRTSWSVQSQGKVAEEENVISRLGNDALTNTACHLPEDSEWYSELQPGNPPDTDLVVEWDSFLESWQIRATHGLIEDAPLLVARKEHLLQYWSNSVYSETSPKRPINRRLHPSDRLKHFFIDLWLYENERIPRMVMVDAEQRTIVKQLWGWEYEIMVEIASSRVVISDFIVLAEQLYELLSWLGDQKREADEHESRQKKGFADVLHRTNHIEHCVEFVEHDNRPQGVFIEDLLWGLEGVFAVSNFSLAPSRTYFRNALNIIFTRRLREKYRAYYAALDVAPTSEEVEQDSAVQDLVSADAVRVAAADWQTYMWTIYAGARTLEDRLNREAGLLED